MPRKGGLFLPLSVNFMDDPKVLRAGEQAAWLYLAMCLTCKRLGESDGVMAELQVGRLGVPGWQKRLKALLEHGLVERLDSEHVAIVGWLNHNDSADEVAAKRAKDAERKRKAGKAA